MVKFACDRCGRSYSVAEELRGRAFKMKCKSCGHLIVVKPEAAPVAQVPPPIPEATPKAFSIPASPPELPATEKGLTFLGAGTEIGDRLSVASAAALSSAPADLATPVPPGPSPDAAEPPAGGYEDFTLEERPGPSQEPTALAPEPRPDERELPMLEPITVTQLQPAESITDAVAPGLKDPFVGWIDRDEPKARLGAEDIQADAETTDPAGPLQAARPIAPPPPSRNYAPTAKKGGLPKPLLFGGAAALVVAGVVVAVATRKAEPVQSPPAAPETAARTPDAPEAPRPLVQLAPPELAAPDPQYLQASGGGATPPKTTPPQGDSSGGSRPEKRREAESGLQGRAVTSRAEKPTRAEQPPAPALMPTVERPPLASPAEKPAAVGRPDSAQLAQIVAANRRAFDDCLSEASSRNPSLRQSGKKATLMVTVIPSGDVTSSRLDDPQLAEPQLTACLKRAAKRMAFPSFEGEPLFVDVPLSFSK